MTFGRDKTVHLLASWQNVFQHEHFSFPPPFCKNNNKKITLDLFFSSGWHILSSDDCWSIHSSIFEYLVCFKYYKDVRGIAQTSYVIFELFDFCIILDLYQNSDLLHHSETWRATMLIRSVENETLVIKTKKLKNWIIQQREEKAEGRYINCFEDVMDGDHLVLVLAKNGRKGVD